MKSYNQIIICGNVGNAPELKKAGDTNVARFSVATTEGGYTNKATGKAYPEKTTWHRIVAWGNLAEVAVKYIAKGTPVFVTGKLNLEEWTDANGQQKSQTIVIASDFILLGGKNDATPAPQVPTAGIPVYSGNTEIFQQAEPKPAMPSDDLLF